jgi:hypothetical protein
MILAHGPAPPPASAGADTVAFVGLTEKAFAVEGRWLMGRIVPHRFLEGIESHLRVVAPGRERELVDAIGARAGELVEADGDMVVDGASKGMLAMSAAVLAAYEVLLREFEHDGPRTILFLQHVFGETLRRSIEIVIEALAGRRSPLDAVDAAMRKSSGMYGSYFDFEFERPDPGTFEMKVTRCFFRDFFTRHDARLVTTVLCAWDANWMQALDPAVSGLRSERTSLLSLGDDACRFRVLATDDPLATYSDALERRFVDEGGGGTRAGRG